MTWHYPNDPRAPQPSDHTAIRYCPGPGPLVQEVPDGIHIVDVQLLEQCPVCEGRQTHRYRRVITAEDFADVELDRGVA